MSAASLLLTGFEPFGGDGVNPSAQVVDRLTGSTIAGHAVTGAILPVDSARVGAVVRDLLESHRPRLVLLTGLAAGRSVLALETGAANLLDFEEADNAGVVVRNRRISEHGAERLFTNLPHADILAAWQRAGIPGVLSESAGSYLCNQALYEVLALNGNSIPTGFIHLPCTPELAAARVTDRPAGPSLPLDTLVAGVMLSLETALGARSVA